MGIDHRILEEIARYNYINNYINEQAPPPPPADPAAPPADPGAPPADPGAGAPPPPDAGAGAPPPPPAGGEPAGGPEADPDVELVDPDEEEGEEGGTEELDITDLVDTQKTMADKQEEYFTNLFDQIKQMESKLAEMDQLVAKIDGIESKLEKYRPKTPQEKLALRSLDSGPYKQNLSDFFNDKKDEMEMTGKNEYVLTQDEVENFSPSEIENSFNEPMEDEDDILLNKFNS